MGEPLTSVLVRVADAVAGAQTLTDLYDAALSGLADALGVERASILLFDPDGVMRFKAWRGLSPEYRKAVEGHTPWGPGSPPAEPILVADVRADASLTSYWPVFEAERIRALAFIPVVSRRRIIGKFMLYRERPYEFSREEVAAALAIAYQIGFAVDRTRKEQEAAQHHQQVLFALDAAQMGTWQWDLRTETVRWSENLERIHGLPPGTFTGEFASYAREIHPDDRERVLTSLRNALDEGAMHDVEYRIVAPDGTVRWVQGKGRVERDAAGVPVSMSGVCMDINRRKRAELDIEAALRQEAQIRDRLTVLTNASRRLLTSLAPATTVDEVVSLAREVVAADGYAVWRRHGDRWRVAASVGLSEAFTSEELENRSTPTFTGPVVAVDVNQTALLEGRRLAYEREGIHSLLSIPLLIGQEPAGSVVFYYRQDHHPSDLEVQVATALGHLAAAAIINAELYQEQQRLRREAQIAETRSAFLAEASAILSSLDYEANLRQLAQLVVPRLADWCTVDLLTGDGTLSRVAVAHVDPQKVAFAHEIQRKYPARLDAPHGVGKVLRTGNVELYEEITDEMLQASAHDADHLQILRDLGLVSAMIVPLRTGAQTFGTLTFVSSSPERRYGDVDLQFATELARRAALAIENSRLYQAAQTANRLKDEFLATLSHELRTPLNVIIGRASMLRTTNGDAAGLRAIGEAIERNAGTLARLVEDLLDLSRITLGQMRLDTQPLRVDAVLTAAVQAVQPAAHAKGLDIVISVSPALPSVVGDPTRLQQVMWNLLANAVKFTPAGGTVTAELAVDPTHVILTVSDTGEGIEPSFLPHVFEMFRQGEPSSYRRHGGLGLGLSIVRRLVELHGGSVTVESRGRDQGAVFTVRLPYAVDPDGAALASGATHQANVQQLH